MRRISELQALTLLGAFLLTAAGFRPAAGERFELVFLESCLPRPAITVRVFNYSGATANTIAEAGREVVKIFDKSGIRTHWLSCPLLGATLQDGKVCPGTWYWTDFLLRVMPRATPDRSENALGFSLPASEGGVVAVIFFDRIEALAKANVGDPGRILGLAIAHEIGHLLLRTILHSSLGIMRSPWDRDEVASDRLLFTREQARIMRTEVIRRMHLPARAEESATPEN